MGAETISLPGGWKFKGHIIKAERWWLCDKEGASIGSPWSEEDARAFAVAMNTDLAAENARLRRELDEVSAAVGGVEFMDPPDGGEVSLGEQVSRMRVALDEARAGAALPAELVALSEKATPGPWRQAKLASLCVINDDGEAGDKPSSPACASSTMTERSPKLASTVIYLTGVSKVVATRL